MIINKKNLILLALLPMMAYSAGKVQNKAERKQRLEKQVVAQKIDTVFVVDTVYLEKEVQSSRTTTMIDYSDSTLSSFDQDVIQLYEDWQTSLSDNDDGLEMVSISDKISDSIYQHRLSEMSQSMVIEMPFNKIVKAHIQVYTERKREHSSYILGKMDYYMPIFEAELDRKGLPIELRCMPIIESGLNPRAYSNAGASGLWQFIYGTGKQYGFEMNSYIDERRDPIVSTVKAVSFLEDLYAVYKDWFLVIAAYNCGPGNVNKAIRRSGGKRDYWAIYYYLPRETRGYVPAFIAANYLIHYAEEHNIKAAVKTLPPYIDTVIVKKTLNLNQVASVMNIDINLLRDLNPQYRLDILPAGSKSYVLTLPESTSVDYVMMEDSIMAYKRSEMVDNKRVSVQPGSSMYTARGVAPAGKVAVTYTVKSGDNLGFIAEWFDVGVSDLRNWNGIYRNLIRVNQKLTVYVPKDSVEKYKKISKTSRAPQVSQSNATQEAVNLSDEYEYYQVRNGDNLWVIARRYPGVSADNIKALNGMTSNDIKPGQYLKIRKI